MAKQPHLLIEHGDIHDIVLVPGDPGRVDRIADHCDDDETISHNREYKVVNASYRDVPITICSTGIGSPSAAIAVEELTTVGASTLIRVGTTGALQREIGIGEMVIPTAAAKNEGTTRRYEPESFPAVPDFDITSSLISASKTNEEIVHIGPITTDDAFYAETESYVSEWSQANILAVEMEAAAIFTLARRNGLRSGAICTVDGNLVTGSQKGETDDEELPPAARNNVGRAIDIALEAVYSLRNDTIPD